MAEISLSEFLGELARCRFRWSTTDCFTVCADWVQRVTGRDPEAPWRMLYRDKKSALRLLRREGGAVALASRAMSAIGMQETTTPICGDVALVMLPVAIRGKRMICRPAAAICVEGQKFAMLSADRGLVIAPMKPIRAWRIAHG